EPLPVPVPGCSGELFRIPNPKKTIRKKPSARHRVVGSGGLRWASNEETIASRRPNHGLATVHIPATRSSAPRTRCYLRTPQGLAAICARPEDSLLSAHAPRPRCYLRTPRGLAAICAR